MWKNTLLKSVARARASAITNGARKNTTRLVSTAISSSSIPSSSSSSSTSTSTSIRCFTSTSASSPSSTVWRVDDPYTGSIYCEVPVLSEKEAIERIQLADKAQQQWKHTTLQQRKQLIQSWIVCMSGCKDAIALSISHQMGKPLSQALGEVDTCIKRAQVLCELSDEALKEEHLNATAPLQFKITKEPVGVVLALSPWNYPLLCTVNATITALLCGNSVLIKHSDRTPLVAQQFQDTFKQAGAMDGLVMSLPVNHDVSSRLISHPSIGFVSFTGSVSGGRAVYQSVASSRFIDVGLELGGKDPAYVADDADMEHAIANVVDGAMYNAGQSCCAVERVYVHKSKYQQFLDGAYQIIKAYQLGDPRQSTTSMGPMAQVNAPHFLHQQVEQAKMLGARVLLGGAPIQDANGKGRFFQPTLIADANHTMDVMTVESFGPILAVQQVESDQQAIQLMNDSLYGLTASVWTQDLDRAHKIMSQVNAGTVFMNRCDFLEPTLPWSGRKDSGKGVGLSSHGFASYYRLKGYNFRTKTK